VTRRAPVPDEAEREAAVHARGVNVVVEAGAGTGKTTILVHRLVELVAPSDDGPALPLSRVAAITFTRKAAGELKLRIREALLEALACADLTEVRRGRLRTALAALDRAYLGTVHAFADRLLRLRPVEARLSPAYQIVDDADELLSETFAVFLQAVERGTLGTELESIAPAVADTAQATVTDALRVGLRAESRQHDFGESPGLDRLFERFVTNRDVPLIFPPPQPPDLGRFRDLVGEFGGFATPSRGNAPGSRFVRETAMKLDLLRGEDDSVRILRELLRLPRSRPSRMRKSVEFEGDELGWLAWKALAGDGRRTTAQGPSYQDLLRPFACWMARRLVAAAPAVVAMYGKVKARHQVVDQVDLLLQLRDLLRDRLDVRADYQGLFDHILVDEFQDTDPLQAEVILYLGERGAKARHWRDVVVAPGKLTLVGDPKQSIYRFRRADISVYAEVRTLVERGPSQISKLTTNFRSHPSLLEWINHRFDEVLGTREGKALAFDPVAGTVLNERLLPGRRDAPSACVELLSLQAKERKKPLFRAAEARALALWIRRLVEVDRRSVVDPASELRRPVGYGDVAVLAASTPNLPLLFGQLDRLGVPYSARGGRLFLSDAFHRQFLLGLRAIADRDDGVAQAALLRPPFFALDLDDIARERAGEEDSKHPGVLRARAALALVNELRRRRFERPPGATARDLLERSAFARAAALGPNGAQRLDSLRELCFALEALAAREGLGYDEATAFLRSWALDPVELDPPRPVAAEAVQILSIHQAKGLEFPVVALWDACADLAARDVTSTFFAERDGTAWALSLGGITWAEPENASIAEREKRFLDAERLRLIYVAATRARELLLLPVAGEPDARWITGRLVAGAPANMVKTLEPYAVGNEPGWAKEVAAPAPRSRKDGTELAAAVGAAWHAASRAAAQPRFVPAAVSSEARMAVQAFANGAGDEEEVGSPAKRREGRFGRRFGETVHLAIGLALSPGAPDLWAAVEQASRVFGLSHHVEVAAEDVVRALAALEGAGLRRAPGPDLRLEYPVALSRDGKMFVGYVDLVGVTGDRLAIVDFKTDPPPRGDVADTYPEYVEQVRSYAAILEALGVSDKGSTRVGLLFTAERAIRWVGPD